MTIPGSHRLSRIAFQVISAVVLSTPVGTILAQSSACAEGHAFNELELFSTQPQQLRSPFKLSKPLSVANIRIVRQNIFSDPQYLLYRKLNEWHSPTRLSTILSALPFKKDEQIDQVMIDEAERLLRHLPYFYDARILINQTCASTVDLDIVVREVWTLTPALSFSREGGESEFQAGIADTNWRGTGRTLSLVFEHEDEESQFDIRYKDHLQPDRWLRSFSSEFGTNSYRYAFALEKPFLTTATESAEGVIAASAKRRNKLYRRSTAISEFDATTRSSTYYRAYLLNASGGKAQHLRSYFGVRYFRESLGEVFFDDARLFERKNSKYIYPYVAWQSISSRFARLPHLIHIGRDEHINLGWNSYFELGFAPSSLSSEQSSLHVDLRLSRRWLFADRHFASASIRSTGRFVGAPQNLITAFRGSYLHSFQPHSKLFFALDLARGRNLDHANFMEIGGDSGMRGYRNHFQTGDRKFSLLAEYRHETSIRPLNLFALGFVGFAETGRAWFSDAPIPWADHPGNKRLTNLGVGVRLHSIRTGSDQTVHIDLARPLTRYNPGSAYELSFTVRRGL